MPPTTPVLDTVVGGGPPGTRCAPGIPFSDLAGPFAPGLRTEGGEGVAGDPQRSAGFHHTAKSPKPRAVGEHEPGAGERRTGHVPIECRPEALFRFLVVGEERVGANARLTRTGWASFAPADVSSRSNAAFAAQFTRAFRHRLRHASEPVARHARRCAGRLVRRFRPDQPVVGPVMCVPMKPPRSPHRRPAVRGTVSYGAARTRWEAVVAAGRR